MIAHCDGGARGNPGPAGYGAVLQTEDGETLAELSEFLGIRTNNYAEYSGLLGVLAWALEHGYRRLRVVSDSELMVKQIQGRLQGELSRSESTLDRGPQPHREVG